MKHGTRIEWTHIPGYKGETWNPITGCSPVSEGCENCYAERISKRFGWPWGEPILHSDRLDQPSRWRKPRAIFVCSMSDLFHEDVPLHALFDIWAEMWAQRHLFLILTKRPENAKQWSKHLSDLSGHGEREVWPRNIWLGVTAENQRTVDERIPILLQIPAAKRFVSVEPMLGAVDLHIPTRTRGIRSDGLPGCNHCCSGDRCNDPTHFDRHRCPYCHGTGTAIELDWAICGGESGPNARPMKWEWAINLLGQCEEARVPFFMKQMSQYGGADRHDIPGILQVKEFPNA